MGLVKIAVAHIQTLPVFAGHLLAGEVSFACAGNIGKRPRFRKFRRRVYLAGNYIQHGRRTRLARKAREHDGICIGRPVHIYRAAAGENYYHFESRCLERLVCSYLIFGNGQRLSVKALRLCIFIEARKEQRHICLFAELYRAVDVNGLMFAVPFKAVGIAYDLEGEVAGIIHHAFQFCGIYYGRTCTLVTGLFGKVADKCNASLRRKRKNAIVFKQNYALVCALFGKFVVSFLIEFLAFFALRGRFYQVENAVYAFIHILYVELAVFHSLNYVVSAVAAAGHLYVAARDCGGNLVVGARPVGYDNAVKAPFAAEYVAEKMFILICKRAVYHIIGRHYSVGMSLLYGNFETGEINLAQGSFIHYRIGDHTALFLAVCRKVLYAGRRAVFLNAAHICRSHFAREVRVFRKIFEVSAATGVALDAKTGSEHHVYALRSSLFAERLAHPFGKGIVPAGRH